jgi:L-ribulokinase
MNGTPLAIGVDFGTASARTLLLDLRSGDELALCELEYAHGVIDNSLLSGGERLPEDWALHDPADYISVLLDGIARVLADVPGAGDRVVGIGVDATSCTVLPVTAAGEPLCTLPQWRARPHAWPKLWKHHAAQRVADRLNLVAAERHEPFLSRYGGRISSEWYFPKLIELWLEDRDVYDATEHFVEVTDWVVWQLCGQLRRSACPAAYKAMWSAASGLPSTEYFEAAYPGFSRPAEKLGTKFYALGDRAGTLRTDLAAKFGLRPGVAVAVGNVDSFVAFPGTGAEGPGTYVMVIGTSICDLVVHSLELPLTGITGVAEAGILPGFFGYEAGQPAVGDMLAWFAALLSSPAGENGGVGTGPRGGDGTSTTLLSLESAAAALVPAQSGLVALDWWNGNRSILADAGLSGVLAGLTLQTGAPEIYRALMESIAFGNKAILDNFEAGGLDIEEIIACGGIAEKSPLLMQLIADISGHPVKVPESSQVPARGSALFGAVAAGQEMSGFSGIAEAARSLSPGEARRYLPRTDATATYDQVYTIYKGLHDTLGRARQDWLHALKRLKVQAVATAGNHLHTEQDTPQVGVVGTSSTKEDT